MSANSSPSSFERKQNILPVTAPTMRQVGEYKFLCLFGRRHLLTVLTGFDDKFKAPKAIFGRTKSTTDRWPRRIAYEIELAWEV